MPPNVWVRFPIIYVRRAAVPDGTTTLLRFRMECVSSVLPDESHEDIQKYGHERVADQENGTVVHTVVHDGLLACNPLIRRPFDCAGPVHGTFCNGQTRGLVIGEVCAKRRSGSHFSEKPSSVD